MASRHTARIADWRIADGVRVEELDGTWLALDAAGGVVYRLEALAAEAVHHVAHRMPLPARLVPAARELAGHGVLEHPLVDRRTALVGAGVVTLTGLAATLLPAASAAASLTQWTDPGGTVWPASGGTFATQAGGASADHYVHVFTSDGELEIRDGAAIADLSILVVAGGGGGGRGQEGAGGGGGAGGLLEVTGATLATGDYTVVVGAGGAGRSGSTGPGVSGQNSRLFTASPGTGVDLTALGGGGGGSPEAGPVAGGSGGGAGADDNSTNDVNIGALVATAGRSSTISAGTPTFSGNAGGNSAHATAANRAQRRAGGGGGATGAGTAGVVNSTAGAGGASITLSDYVVPGVSGDFAGGGGGAGGLGSPSGAGGAGGGAGAGAGGFGSSTSAAGGSATANTGSGGGGSTDAQNGGNGGSGIVILRYRLA